MDSRERPALSIPETRPAGRAEADGPRAVTKMRARALGRLARDGVFDALIPRRLRRNHRRLSDEGLAAVAASLERNYFIPRFGPEYLLTPEGRVDHDSHMLTRVDLDRRTVVPWLNNLSPLANSTVVEIGCGTGGSTIALAEQGARVIGFDLDGDSLAAAKDRCAAYGLHAELLEGNAADLPEAVVRASDMTIFFASLEHMTLDERLAALSNTWRCLRPGAWLVIIETPNRLWWFDAHTAQLPFYMWLPDDLAVHYAKYSKRWPFNEEVAPPATDAALVTLARIGRSASYHEFQLSLGDLTGLEIRGMGERVRRNPIEWARWAVFDRSFQRVLARLGPSGIPAAFYEPWLNLAIRKP